MRNEIANITADAGYGSCENYEYLADQDITSYIKYNTFDIEHKRKTSKKAMQNIKDRQFLYYNAE
ncbi:IS1182 family transposase, partial [Acinetobacter haemolyticus]|nr:IS1182 family transposase [Acinetobacter haemolyticus]